MKLLSVNIGRPRTVAIGGAVRETGIWKAPVEGTVRVTRDGLAGDAVCDRRHHGGPDQAVYVYGAPDYAWWSETLSREVGFGTFRENLTISDLETGRLGIGDRLVAGPVVLEVSAPRVPCRTLARRMNDPTFVERFRSAERPGLYCRVVVEGAVGRGDPVRHEARAAADPVTVLELFRDFYATDRDEDTLRRYLAAPIPARDRVAREKQLAELLSRAGRRKRESV